MPVALIYLLTFCIAALVLLILVRMIRTERKERQRALGHTRPRSERSYRAHVPPAIATTSSHSNDYQQARSDEQAIDVNVARMALQKVSYEMVGKRHSAETKARFKQGMTKFAAMDPLVREIAIQAREIVAANPGQLQSKIYPYFPRFSQEQVRYALYFAHELGWIYRKKKGNSYQLFPPGNTIDQ